MENKLDKDLLSSLEVSINRMGTALRVQSERWFELPQKILIDENDAITNLENSFDSVLETCHSVDDCLRKLKIINEQNSSMRFLNLIRNIRHHNSSKLPYSLTKSVLQESWSGEWYAHPLKINEEISETQMLIPIEITNFFEITSGFIENGRLKQKHLDSIISDFSLENFLHSIKNDNAQVVLDINPVLISSLSYLFKVIESNNLNLKLLDDADTYLFHFCSMETVVLLKPKIYLPKKYNN